MESAEIILTQCKQYVRIYFLIFIYLRHYNKQNNIFEMKYHAIDPKLYALNRERFIKKMKPNSIAIFHAHPTLPENGDANLSRKTK
jgi:hypothetical protein